MPGFEVIGIGSPLVDHLLYVPESYVESIGGEKFGMELVDYPKMIAIIEESGKKPVLLAGGSAANTAKALASLGSYTAFIGKSGKDPAAETFLQGLAKANVAAKLVRCDTPTGHAVCLITPDGNRTCRTYPGASLELVPEDLDPEIFYGAKWVHIEGYALLNDSLAERAMHLANEAGAKISFDLGSFELVRTYRKRILKLAEKFITCIFANEAEACQVWNSSAEESAKRLSDICPLALVMQGDKGGIIGQNGKTNRFATNPVTPVDTTGGGDFFAAGFIHGQLLDQPPEICAKIGALCGRAVVQVVGTQLLEESWADIRKEILLFT